jgi:MoxR-like ATPase
MANDESDEMANLEDVFVTEGVPEYTFVKPPNYSALLVDIRRKGKPVIVEGQSGTGKTTAVRRAISEIYPNNVPQILTPREPSNITVIEEISADSGDAIFIIDDFHRLTDETKERLGSGPIN